MADRESLSSSIQESITTCVCLCDDEYSNLIAARIELSFFEPPFVDIVSRALDYRKRYGKAPGTGHIDDIFDFALLSKNERVASTYRRVLQGMLEQLPNINPQYVSGRITEFARRQKLKAGVLKAAEKYQGGGDNIADEVERILLDTVNQKFELEDSGTFFGDKKKVFAAFAEEKNDYCRLNIQELDRRRICPTKQQLFLLIAPRKRGKSWACVHCGKLALRQHWKVAHITLEMNEESVIRRYVQALFSAASRDENFPLPNIQADEFGHIVSMAPPDLVKPKLHFEDPDLRKKLTKEWDKYGYFRNLCIKKFPTGQLTVPKLEAYLDSLEIVHKFVPDMLIVDYPDLMAIDIRQPVISLGRIFVDLRGIADKRNMAVVTVTQTTREGESASTVQSAQVAGDISKVATADTVITYSQTDLERQLGLARLFVNNARNDRDRFTTLISQSYDIGQFALASAYMPPAYFDRLEGLKGQLKHDLAAD